MSPPTNLEKAKAERELLSSKADFVEQRVNSHGTTPLTEISATNLLRLVSSHEVDLEEVHKRILHCAPADAATHNGEYITILDKLMNLRCILETILSAFPKTPSTSSSASSRRDIKLPTLELPKFTGDLSEWLPYRDMFVATVASNSHLTGTEKLIHLKRSLHGEAARVIETLQLTEANYQIAWDALTSRYQNPRELIFSAMKKVLNQKEVTPNSAASIRQLVDITKSNIRYFAQMGGSVENIFVYILFTKFDTQTRELWLQANTTTTIPSPDDVYKFLETRATALAAGSSSNGYQRHQRSDKPRPTHIQTHHGHMNDKCSLKCSDVHRLYKCPKFLEFNVQQRVDHLKKTNICFNCLTPGHSVLECRSSSTCRTCRRKHNTLIHNNHQQKRDNQSQDSPANQQGTAESHHGHLTQLHSIQIPKGILATAIIRVTGEDGDIFIRALLDGGSTNSYITFSLVKKLRLQMQSTNVNVTGLGATEVNSPAGISDFIIKPRFKSSHSFQVTAFVIDKISNQIPSCRLPQDEFSHLNNLELADPEFQTPSQVDVLIGAELFWSLLEMEKRSGSPGQPLALKTALGWIIAGAMQQHTIAPINFMTNTQLNESLHKLFAAEDPRDNPQQHTPEEEKCEQFFISNVKRDLSTGRFTTPIPWKECKTKLGDSKQAALRRLFQMERRLSLSTANEDKRKKNQHYKDEYMTFMKEYIDMQHMEPVPDEEVQFPKHQVNYIPHHFVLKNDSTTTKFRVVFDGSIQTSSGISMNSAMMIGPTIQSSLFDIILRFRTHRIAFSADIAKMYRQIHIPEADQDMHRILWRNSTADPVQEFRLKTVTYGTASAPYLATRTLQHLITLEGNNYPLGASIAEESFYVDDLMAGSNDSSTAIEGIRQLINMCNTAGFPLRKWTCNDAAVLNSIPVDLRETKELVQIKTEDSVKTLGIHWNPAEDTYSFKISLPESTEQQHTKRSIYSEMSMLFDPLGWLAPATVKSKLIMQAIWKLKVDWNSIVPDSIQQQWIKQKQQLKLLEQIKIPRFVLSATYTDVQLVGYADASQLAMAACVYIAHSTQQGKLHLSLLTAKTRIAPLVPPTLPRLELNAAVLLIELLNKVRNALKLKFSQVKAFSDSKIVLAWIHSDPLRWKTYVRSRVSTIQRLSTGVTWAHIKGKDNPADCASRGLFPEEVIHHTLWWNGNAEVLSSSSSSSSEVAEMESNLQEVSSEENTKVVCHHSSNSSQFRFITYFSDWKRLINFMALIIRAQHNFKQRKQKSLKTVGEFTSTEVHAAQMEIIKVVQTSCFTSDIKILSTGQQLPATNKLISLSPFIDDNGLLRVGGRLHHADIPFDQKHPILLPRHHHITKLIIMNIHDKTMHGGPQITLSTLTQQFWVTRGRDAVRFFLKKCVLCTRLKAVTLNQIMGNLPKTRLIPNKAFQTTGIDYAGPLTLKLGQRSKITTKAYIVVFVCFSTRALHLEVASSLSTDGFIAAFRRFLSRRGIPLNIYTDCGTNFIGARKVLNQFHDLFLKEADRRKLTDELNQHRVHWHLNPPGAPHFGGLWEAGVKSVKKHLYSVIGKELLTYEELNTLIIQIEGILNSRPMTAMSTNPEDLKALTPAHFLIGGPITALPEPSLEDAKINRLDRWQLIQRKQQTFWRRWSSEYISRLQQRPKWIKEQPLLNLNSIVVIKDENSPPARWRLGRVIALHPGDDDLVRVVTLKTMNGELKRPITKICVLPVE